MFGHVKGDREARRRWKYRRVVEEEKKKKKKKIIFLTTLGYKYSHTLGAGEVN